MFATLKLLVSEAVTQLVYAAFAGPFFFLPGGSVLCPVRDMTLSLHVPSLTWRNNAATAVAGSLDLFFLRLNYTLRVLYVFFFLYERHIYEDIFMNITLLSGSL